MKTLCFTLGLLLLTACCCNAMPEALRNTAPRNCCFNFYKSVIPLKFVSDITKTNSSCLNQAFIVKTIKGRKICFRQTFKWALKAYKQLHKGQQH